MDKINALLQFFRGDWKSSVVGLAILIVTVGYGFTGYVTQEKFLTIVSTLTAVGFAITKDAKKKE